MRLVALLLLALSPVARAASGCSFQFDPAADVIYVRSEGWVLPGISDIQPSAPVKNLGQYPYKNIPGAKAFALPHEEDPYVVEFPAEEFQLNGVRERMRTSLVKAVVLRWEMHSRVFAYSYGLVPVVAHRVKGNWHIDDEAACTFQATFIDDKGDGVFRLLVPTSLREDLIPVWVKQISD